MGVLQGHRLPLGAILAAGVVGYLAYDSLPPRVPVHWGMNGAVDNFAPRKWAVCFHPSAMALAYLFFLFVARTDRGRTHQLRRAGIFDRLRNGAVLLFGYAHLLSLGVGLGIVSPRANFLVGAASLTTILIGDYLRHRSCTLSPGWLRVLGIGACPGALQLLGIGCEVAGGVGLVGTLTGRLQPLWPTVTCLAGLLLTRRRFPAAGRDRA